MNNFITNTNNKNKNNNPIIPFNIEEDKIISNPSPSLKEILSISNKSKKEKGYTLGKGRLPNIIKGKLEVPFNIHTSKIIEAIDSLVKEGKIKVSRKELIERIERVGLYKEKASKSSPSYILNWWSKSLKYLGYILENNNNKLLD